MSNKELYPSIDDIDREAKSSGGVSTQRPIKDGTIDVDDLVAGMAHLVEEYPNWEDHLPQEAAIGYHEDEDYQNEYREHVESCGFCQQLIDTFNPPDRALGDFLAEVVEAATPSSDDTKEQEESANMTVEIGKLVSRLFGPDKQFDPLPVPAAAFGYDTLIRPRVLEILERAEHSKDPIDRFGVAEVYLKYHRPGFAYKALGEGLRMCGIDELIVGRISEAPKVIHFGSEFLMEIAKELESTADETPNLLRKVELNAQAGKHCNALKSIYDIVDGQGTNSRAASSDN